MLQHKILSPNWNPYANPPFMYNAYQTTVNNTDSIYELAEQLADLSITDRRIVNKPPSTYLCHLCFQKGHYIKDCPEVSDFHIFINYHNNNFLCILKILSVWFNAVVQIVLALNFLTSLFYIFKSLPSSHLRIISFTLRRF